ncbi:hypothetical protein GCM10029978_034590 [Actinoallomurus acanthiterrae]
MGKDKREDGGSKPPGTRRCSRCGGLGAVTDGAGRSTCPVCEGAGIVRNP